MKTCARVLVVLALASMLASLALLAPMRSRAGADPATGEPARGAMLFRQCAACHSVEPGLHLTGPSLAAVWGRRAATVGGFGRYSTALEHAGVSANEAVFVDDMPENIESARALGMSGVLFRDRDATITQLNNLIYG